MHVEYFTAREGAAAASAIHHTHGEMAGSYVGTDRPLPHAGIRLAAGCEHQHPVRASSAAPHLLRAPDCSMPPPAALAASTYVAAMALDPMHSLWNSCLGEMDRPSTVQSIVTTEQGLVASTASCGPHRTALHRQALMQGRGCASQTPWWRLHAPAGLGAPAEAWAAPCDGCNNAEHQRSTAALAARNGVPFGSYKLQRMSRAGHRRGLHASMETRQVCACTPPLTSNV